MISVLILIAGLFVGAWFAHRYGDNEHERQRLAARVHALEHNKWDRKNYDLLARKINELRADQRKCVARLRARVHALEGRNGNLH